MMVVLLVPAHSILVDSTQDAPIGDHTLGEARVAPLPINGGTCWKWLWCRRLCLWWELCVVKGHTLDTQHTYTQSTHIYLPHIPPSHHIHKVAPPHIHATSPLHPYCASTPPSHVVYVPLCIAITMMWTCVLVTCRGGLRPCQERHRVCPTPTLTPTHTTPTNTTPTNTTPIHIQHPFTPYIASSVGTTPPPTPRPPSSSPRGDPNSPAA